MTLLLFINHHSLITARSLILPLRKGEIIVYYGIRKEFVTLSRRYLMMINTGKQLNQYLTEYWEYVLQHNPTFATYIGDHRYDDSLEDLSEASMSAQAGYFQNLLVRAEKIDVTALTAEDTINWKLLKLTLQNHIRLHQLRTYYIPLDHLQGPHINFPQIIEYHPFQTQQNFKDYISRLKAFPLQVDQVIELLQKGIANTITAFRTVIGHVLGQFEMFTKGLPESNPLFAPVLNMNDSFSEQDKEEIRNAIQNELCLSVTPAYQRLYEYLQQDYLQHCREEAGIWSLPEGNAMYRFYVKYHTTTDLSPEEIHEIGVSEVARIEGEMRKIMGAIGFDGNLREFAVALKQKKDLYPGTGQEILDAYRTILSQMDQRLPEYFGRLPRARYAVKAIEPYREQAAPAAYYYPPPRDFSRPGYFYANTYRPERRPTYDMEALAYHEAVPGHHLQVALMQELQDIPDFRRHEGSTAFIEGWALYAEKLAKEMGLYQDNFSEYGRLSFELWRAVRLVVDTGLHFYQWGREKAIHYCKDNTGLDDHEIEVEVDRYIAMPGQALSYKIGELTIQELREKAKSVLGSQFDIKTFHDRLLQSGALPLYILKSVMNTWIESS